MTNEQVALALGWKLLNKDDMAKLTTDQPQYKGFDKLWEPPDSSKKLQDIPDFKGSFYQCKEHIIRALKKDLPEYTFKELLVQAFNEYDPIEYLCIRLVDMKADKNPPWKRIGNAFNTPPENVGMDQFQRKLIQNIQYDINEIVRAVSIDKLCHMIKKGFTSGDYIEIITRALEDDSAIVKYEAIKGLVWLAKNHDRPGRAEIIMALEKAREDKIHVIRDLVLYAINIINSEGEWTWTT